METTLKTRSWHLWARKWK